MTDELTRRAEAALRLNDALECTDERDAIIQAFLLRDAEQRAEIARLRSRFTKLDKPKHTGEPMLDHVLTQRNPEFDAWVASLPDTYWARYDLSAARIGWEARQAEKGR